MESFATPYPLIFFDGETERDVGVIGVHSVLAFKRFQSQIAQRTGLPANQLSAVFVCRRTVNDVEKKQKLPINENTNFCIILNQHNPSREKDAHFLISVKKSKKDRKVCRKKVVEEEEEEEDEVATGAGTEAVEKGNVGNGAAGGGQKGGVVGATPVNGGVLGGAAAGLGQAAPTSESSSSHQNAITGTMTSTQTSSTASSGVMMSASAQQQQQQREAAMRERERLAIASGRSHAVQYADTKGGLRSSFAANQIAQSRNSAVNFSATANTANTTAASNSTNNNNINNINNNNPATTTAAANTSNTSTAAVGVASRGGTVTPPTATPPASVPSSPAKIGGASDISRGMMGTTAANPRLGNEGSQNRNEEPEGESLTTNNAQNLEVEVQPEPSKSCKFCSFCREKGKIPPFHWCVDDSVVLGFRGPSPAGPIRRPVTKPRVVQASA